MSEKNHVEEYKKAVEKVKQRILDIKPFLENFSREHDGGTGFYEDITILSGPSVNEYNFFKEKFPDLFELSVKPPKDDRSVSVYNLKFGGATFVLEYKKVFAPNDVYKVAPKWELLDSFMLYKHIKYPLPKYIAESIKQLYWEQEGRSAIYGAHREEIDKAMNAAKGAER